MCKRPWSRTGISWSLVLPRTCAESFQTSFASLAVQHHGGSWIPRSTYIIKRKGPRQYATITRYNCAFKKASGCPFTMRTIGHEDDTWEIELGHVKHNDHTEHLTSGLPKKLKLALAPLSFEKTPRELKLLAARDHQQVLTPALGAQITSLQKRERLKGDGVNLPANVRSTFGGMATLMHFTPREELLKLADFTPDTAWLLAPAQVDGDLKRIIGVFSTDNLLLNGYRADDNGLPCMVSLDCTYRLTAEGPGCMVLGTVSPDQRWHTISYSLVNREDTDAHAYVLASTKAAIEVVVAERSRANLPI